MSATASPARPVIGLFPELLGIGGVQEAGRMTAMALQNISAERGDSAIFLSLNDPPGPHTCGSEPEVALTGYYRDKMRFTVAALRQARAANHAQGGNSSAHRSIALAAHPNLAVPLGWMRAVSPSLRTIVMTHGVEVWSPLSPSRRSALAGADAVLAPSRYTARHVADIQLVPPEKIHHLPWPLNPQFLRFADDPAGLQPPQDFPSGQIILTVGRWMAGERYKGADELIAAVASLAKTFPDLRLVAVGGGDDLPRLRNVAKYRGVAARVHFLEGLNREQTAACYARADIFALPSTGEGFGLVFLEAMAFAKPLVGVAAGGATDLIEDGVNGLLAPPNDGHALRQTLSRLLESESLRRELGHNGSQIVREKYSFAAFQRELAQILDGMAAG